MKEMTTEQIKKMSEDMAKFIIKLYEKQESIKFTFKKGE